MYGDKLINSASPCRDAAMCASTIGLGTRKLKELVWKEESNNYDNFMTLSKKRQRKLKWFEKTKSRPHNEAFGRTRWSRCACEKGAMGAMEWSAPWAFRRFRGQALHLVVATVQMWTAWIRATVIQGLSHSMNPGSKFSKNHEIDFKCIQIPLIQWNLLWCLHYTRNWRWIPQMACFGIHVKLWCTFTKFMDLWCFLVVFC